MRRSVIGEFFPVFRTSASPTTWGLVQYGTPVLSDCVTLKMMAVRSFETSGTKHLMTLHQITEGVNRQQHHCDSLKYHSVVEVNCEPDLEYACPECKFNKSKERLYTGKIVLSQSMKWYSECNVQHISVWIHWSYILIYQKVKNWMILHFHSWNVMHKGKTCKHCNKLETGFRYINSTLKLVCHWELSIIMALTKSVSEYPLN